MNTLSLRSNNTNTVWNFEQSRGVSEFAEKISEDLEDIRRDIKIENVTFGASLSEALNELDEVALDASVDNWDGFGAKKINKDSYLDAKKFLNNLPVGLEMPEIDVHPDGEVSFEWYKKKGYILSLSLSSDDEIAYAFRLGLSKKHGKEYFGDDIPETILEKIKKLSS